MARPAMTPAREGFSMAAALAGFTAEQLSTLLRARPDLASPPPRDLAALAARASHRDSINACLITQNQACLHLVDALCLLPQPTTVAALVKILNVDLDPGDLDAALRRLGDVALVFRRGAHLRVHPQLERLSHPAGLGPPARTMLAAQHTAELATMAQLLGITLRASHHELTAGIAAALGDNGLLKRLLLHAPPGTVPLVIRLADQPVERIPWGTYNVRPDSPLGWLAARGMVVATDWSTFVMPREVGLALRGGRPFPGFTLQPPALVWRPLTTRSAERDSVETALRLVADIVTVLDGWHEAPPKLLKAGGIGVRDVRKASKAIGRTEVETARLIDLAGAGGLAGWDTVTETALPRPAYDDWLELPLAERWVAVVRAWLDARLHVSVAGAMATNDKPIPPLLDRWPESPARHRRRLVLAALLEAEPGQVPEPDSLVARVTWDAPAAWTGGPATPPTLVSWVRDEAEMLGVCAGGGLSAIGRAMVSGRVDQAVTELAAHTPKITAQFVIQADLTAVATGPLTASVRCQLELMADLESSGSATVYRFGDGSLRRAYDDGWTAEAILGFLDSHATKGVPQALRYLVEDVGRRHGRLRVGGATCFLRADDPSLLEEVLTARRTAKLGLRRLAPTVLVSPAAVKTVIDTLRAAGYLPAEEDDRGEVVVRHREAVRADEGFGPPNDLGKGLAWAPVSSAGGSGPPPLGPTTTGGEPSDEELASLVSRLRTARGPDSVEAAISRLTWGQILSEVEEEAW